MTTAGLLLAEEASDVLSGPRLVVLAGIVVVMAVVVFRAIIRIQRNPWTDDIKQMSLSERRRAGKLARSAAPIDDALDRRRAERFLRYVAHAPKPTWRFFALLVGLGVIFDVVEGDTWQDMIVDGLQAVVLFSIAGLLVWHFDNKQEATAAANGWTFRDGGNDDNPPHS